jgi:hypothetical protein
VSVSGNGWAQTLDLTIMGQVFYHCATTKPGQLNWNFQQTILLRGFDAENKLYYYDNDDF